MLKRAKKSFDCLSLTFIIVVVREVLRIRGFFRRGVVQALRDGAVMAQSRASMLVLSLANSYCAIIKAVACGSSVYELIWEMPAHRTITREIAIF